MSPWVPQQERAEGGSCLGRGRHLGAQGLCHRCRAWPPSCHCCPYHAWYHGMGKGTGPTQVSLVVKIPSFGL